MSNSSSDIDLRIGRFLLPIVRTHSNDNCARILGEQQVRLLKKKTRLCILAVTQVCAGF